LSRKKFGRGTDNETFIFGRNVENIVGVIIIVVRKRLYDPVPVKNTPTGTEFARKRYTSLLDFVDTEELANSKDLDVPRSCENRRTKGQWGIARQRQEL
jgi:hypothetical protein